MPTEFAQPEDLGLWRFGIISPLLHRSEDAPPLRAQIQKLTEGAFYTPCGRERRLCPDTIRDWLCRYRTCGIDGLRNRPRKDRGGTSVPTALGQALADARKSQPEWTVTRLLRTLRERGQWDGRKPSWSALYRYTAAHALSRAAVQPPQPIRCPFR